MNQMGVVCGSFLGPIVETNATAVESSSGASSVGIAADIGARVATPAPEDCDRRRQGPARSRQRTSGLTFQAGPSR
jgi:hypothetical protein